MVEGGGGVGGLEGMGWVSGRGEERTKEERGCGVNMLMVVMRGQVGVCVCECVNV